ncbi:MAG: peptidylprolyl isomerase [Pseudarcicella sp.]|nr:peptidylprolyl isomerase [Pseudarcicella sp.]MBP6411373.1 peptidylprolyl isomerase [Pseudarcicella sp.]
MRKFNFLLCLSIILCSNILFSQKNTVLDKIIAKVDNHYVLKSELESQYQEYLKESKGGQTPTKCQLFESLIVNKLLLAKAEIDSITIEDKRLDSELNARMEAMEQQFGSSKNIVEAYGKSIITLKDEVRQTLKEQMLTQKMQQNITENVKITPKEVKAFFDQIPKDSLPYLSPEVEVGHIIRLAKVTKAQKSELLSRLNDYKNQVNKGANFEDLAMKHSEDIGSGKKGGDLGFAKRGQMVAPFEAAALKLKPGEMSEVIESEFGFHLIKMVEIRGQEYHVKHILLRPDYQRLDLKDATAYLDSIKVLIQRDSLTFEAAAKLHSEDKNTQYSGGMLVDPQTRSIKLPLDGTMEPSLFFAMDTMTIGKVSAPMPFRTEDGRSAVRILYYKAKHPAHFANFKDDYAKLSAAAMGRKKNSALEKWFMKAKDEVFIFVEDEYKSCNPLQRNQ